MRKQEEIQEKATEDFQNEESSPSSPEEIKRDRNKIRDLFKVKLYTIRSETEKREREID